jgi:hypothetical protein
MVLYELVNPSDACTFQAPNTLIATLVTVVLGGGQYSATLLDTDAPGHRDVPFFMFGGFDEWWATHGDGGPSDGAADRAGAAFTEALRSVCYGSASTRRLFDSALAAIDDPAKRAAFIAQWNDEKRSSLNNIMGRAHALADRLDRKMAEGNPMG